jgi:hypothetical protein
LAEVLEAPPTILTGSTRVAYPCDSNPFPYEPVDADSFYYLAYDLVARYEWELAPYPALYDVYVCIADAAGLDLYKYLALFGEQVKRPQ